VQSQHDIFCSIINVHNYSIHYLCSGCNNSIISSRLDYANAVLHGTSTGCWWHRTRWPESCVRPHVPPVLPSYVSSSTGCLFNCLINGSTTSFQSSHTGRDQLATRPTYISSSTTIYQQPTHIAIIGQIVTYCTSNGASIVSERVQH